jgi:hypothetical protein
MSFYAVNIDINNIFKLDVATLANEIQIATQQALEIICDLIVGYAKVYVPVDTGSLRDSIRKERGGEGMGWREYRVRAGGYIVNPKTGRLVDYAWYVEQWSHFMENALGTVEPEMMALLEGTLRSGLQDVVT